MKKIFIPILCVASTLFIIVGCSSNEVQQSMSSLNDESVVLKNKNEEQAQKIDSLSNQIEDYKHQLEVVEGEYNDFKSNTKQEQDKSIITLEELRKMDEFDGFKIVELETDPYLSMNLEGYFLLEGNFTISEMYGDIFFYGSSSHPKDKIFKTKIKFDMVDFVKEINEYFSVDYDDEQLRSDIGEELYGKWNKAIEENDLKFSLHAVALFKSYSIFQKYESEGAVSAELVKIIEVDN